MRHSLNTIASHIYCLQNRTGSFMSVLCSFWCGCIRHTAVPLKPDSDCSKSVEHTVGDERKDFDCAALENKKKKKARNHYCAVEKEEVIIGGSGQTYHFCRDKGFCPTNICRDKHVSVAASIPLLRQNTSFVAANTCLPRQKVLSRRAYFCRDKRRVLWRQTRVSHNKTVVATKIILVAKNHTCGSSRQW